MSGPNANSRRAGPDSRMLRSCFEDWQLLNKSGQEEPAQLGQLHAFVRNLTSRVGAENKYLRWLSTAFNFDCDHDHARQQRAAHPRLAIHVPSQPQTAQKQERSVRELPCSTARGTAFSRVRRMQSRAVLFEGVSERGSKCTPVRRVQFSENASGVHWIAVTGARKFSKTNEETWRRARLRTKLQEHRTKPTNLSQSTTPPGPQKYRKPRGL